MVKGTVFADCEYKGWVMLAIVDHTLENDSLCSDSISRKTENNIR
jgi:hypothetical protein